MVKQTEPKQIKTIKAVTISLEQQLAQRNVELAILNTVQRALASRLDLQAIYNLVGDQVHEIFKTEVVYIAIRNPAALNVIDFPYYLDRGKRLEIPTSQLGEGLTSKVILTNRPLIAQSMQAQLDQGGIYEKGEESQSYLGMPIGVGDFVAGVVSVQSYQQNAFDEAEVRLLSTLASSLGVALENARLFDETQRLLNITEERAAELAVINSVQAALAAKLDMQAIYDAVGDKIQEIFDAQVVDIGLFDPADQLLHFPYTIERGERFPDEPLQLIGFRKYVIQTQQSLLINENMVERAAKYGNPLGIQGEVSKACLFVPMLVGGEAKGVISLQNLDHENAFTESDVSLLTTLANAMSVALENARLFDETQRLFRVEQERVAELQIINSIQQGLASELDFHSIIEVVGDELRKVFQTLDLGIDWYDEKTNLIHYLLLYERGQRLEVPPQPPRPGGVMENVLKTHQPVLLNNLADYDKLNSATPVPGTTQGKSYIAAPIITTERVVGLIGLEDFENENAFGESELRLLTTIAASLGTALENARLFDETQRLLKLTEDRAAELAIINSVQEGLASKLEMQAIYDLIGDKIRDIFDAQVVDIGLFDPTDQLLHFPYIIERGERFPDEPLHLIGFRKHVIQTQHPLLINEKIVEAAEKYGNPLAFQGEASKACLYVPMLVGGEAKGVISLQNLDHENAFSESDVSLLTTLTNAMSVALENARLFDETQRLLKITEERAQELAILNSVGEAMAKTLDVKTVTRIVGDKVRDIFGAEVTEILLRDANSNFIHVPYAFAKDYQDVEPFAMGDGLTSKVILSGKPLVLDTFEQGVELGALTPTDEDKTESYMGVPIVAGEKMLGVVSVQSYKQNAYNQSHVHLLQTLSSNMGVAIENARLFDETQRLLKITEERAAELAIINSVQEGLASKLIMQAIYDLIGDKIRDIFDAQVVDIGIYDRNEKLLHFPYTIERGVRFPDEPMGLIGYRKHAMETHQPLLITDDTLGAAAKYGNPLIVQGELPQSLLFVPMLVGGEAIGVISLQNLDHENAFTASDVSLLMTLTNAMSVALENARLFDETQRLLRVTEDRAAELGAISKVSQALIVESELDNTIQLIGNQMREIFSADIVYLALLDTQTNLIHFPYQYGEAFTTLTLGQGLTSKIIQTGEPLLINQDVMARTAQIGATRVGKEALSYLGVPIKTGKGTIGVISVQSTTQEGLFNDDSLRLLTTIAANAGAALHNAQLFSDALENLRQVEILTNAASAIEQSAYEPAMIESVAARTDALGELARVFRKMADEVRLREQRLKRQLAQMQLDIEEKKLAKAETVAIYVPMDRRQAMAEHLTLPERAHGTALFADVSGFTALTESLANELGLQRGAEEMIRHLNRVLTTLIDEVHRYSGAVINFSGDAITCWFDDLDLHGHPRSNSSVERAAACAFAMQEDMTQFAAINTPNGKTIGLSIKVALASGPTRRMVVGDGNAHQIDVLAGATLTALAGAEHVAEKGEIVFSATGFSFLEEKFSVSSWREGRQFAVLAGLKQAIAPSPWPELGEDAILKSRLRPWMHPAVFEKVRAGQSEMLSELRPATALFMKFGGLDYDQDPEAEKKLKAFIQWVEQVIAPHHGAIIQFTVGDKGSYIYIVFGAPIAHLDDTVQAVFTALELAAPPESLAYMTGLFIGMASGQMRAGAYGGASHRTYGAIGDRTNLEARLMVAASRSSVDSAEGQRAIVFCNDSVYQAVYTQVEFESIPSIMVKGKSEPIAIYRPLRKLVEPGAESGSALDSAQLIDQLSSAEQLTLKVASVIGQLFTLEAVAAIYPEKQARENLQKHLQNLADLDLIVKRSGETSGYNFKDAQTHAAAYNLMLFAQRRQLHHTMAELLEQTLFNVPPYAEIAHHWQAADEIPKAIEFLEKAGEHARQMGDFEAATRFFNESLALNN
ncbi:MAG: GAF domain-containing protein [Chloroflexi bacterium]|nr:GAF domain-containing protein [Chloroflexota bacterium]